MTDFSPAYTQAFGIVIGEEGGFGAEPADPGNWTSGIVGQGRCLGTKYGVDTASYADTLRRMPPDVAASMPASVAGLTLDQARAIYQHCYWALVSGDALPPPLALMVFDAAVNNGPARAARWLQAAVDAAVDGQIGPETLKAVAATASHEGGAALCAEYLAQRIAFMGSLPTWRTFGLGWSRRLAALPFKAMNMTGSAK